MNKQLILVCERLDWNVEILKNDVQLSKFSPAGEDFFFTVDKQNFLTEIINYAENFDADEHAEMWVKCMDSVRGVPQSIRTLIEDADAIKEMLLELAEKLTIRSKKLCKIYK